MAGRKRAEQEVSWKRIRSSTFVLTAVIVVSKLAGMARDVILANYFGTSDVSDAYLIAASVPTLLFYFIGHSLSTAYLPMYNKIRREEGGRAALRYSNALMCGCLAAATVIVLLLVLFPGAVIKVFAAGFHDETADLAARLIRSSAVSLYFMVIVTIWGGYLQANENYVLPAAISLPRNIVIVVSIVIAAKFDLFFLGVGLLFAYIAEYLLLLPFVVKAGYSIHPCFDVRDEGIRETLYLILPVLLGVSVNQVNKIVDRAIASTLVEGGISALSYASVLNNAVQEVTVTGIITVMFADCAALAAKGEHERVRDRLTRTFDVLMVVLIPASVGMIVLAEPIISLFLQRGSFDHRSAAWTAAALKCYAAGLFFHAARDAMVKMFYAYKDTKTAAGSSVAAIGVNVVLNFIFSKFWGLSGLAAATSMSAVFQSGFLYVVFSKKHQTMNIRALLSGGMRCAAAALFMGVVVHAVYYRWLPGNMAVLFKLLFSVTGGVGIYAAVSLVVNQKRLMNVLRSIFN